MVEENLEKTTSISVRDVNKCFHIYHRPADRLRQIIFRNGKFYDEYTALENISFDISQGETLGIIGRNGSGKSTLLKLICGTLSPTSGVVSVNGRVAALLELGFGFNPEFTGRENIYLSASILGLSETEISKRYQAIADFAGIGDFIDQPVKLYSSGMYARLAFAVAAHVDADILIIDEILSVGDVAFTQKCMRFINQFKKHGTLLFVSHDTSAVIKLCDRVIWLDRGVVKEHGEPREVCRKYLAYLYQSREDSESFTIGGRRRVNSESEAAKTNQDVRRELLKQSDKRNDIEIFDFDSEAPWFGEQGATIEKVYLSTPDDESLTFIEGGEEVVIHIDCRAKTDIYQPIIGFSVKDRLGQDLFSDNTFLSYCNEQVSVKAGQRFSAAFHFRMPYLPTGSYSVTVAIAEGTQTDHKQHQWIDEALLFRVTSSHVARGLMGVPMINIELLTEDKSVESLSFEDN